MYSCPRDNDKPRKAKVKSNSYKPIEKNQFVGCGSGIYICEPKNPIREQKNCE